MFSTLLLLTVCNLAVLGEVLPRLQLDQVPLFPAPAESVDGTSPLYLSTSCRSVFLGKPIRVPVDTCYKTTEPYLRITWPALCADGTYAKLAIYDDEECKSMIIITPLCNESIGSCLQTDIAHEFHRPLWNKDMKGLKVLCKASSEYDKSLARNATIKLFTASTTNLQPRRNDSCTGTTFNEVSLAADVCLSGDYYLSNNMLITSESICANGQLPVMIYYQARGCVGKVQYTSGGRAPNICIWDTLSPRYWSMIWRCGQNSDLLRGAKGHQVAIPPPAPNPDAPQSAVVSRSLNHTCSEQYVGGNEIITVPSGNCLATPGYVIQILLFAVCHNGTRAQWARFEDAHCGDGAISAKYGLVDLADEDQRKDLSLSRVQDNNKLGSIAFWCDRLTALPDLAD